MFKRIYNIPSSFLKKRGLTTLLLDVDNTLTTDNNPLPDKKVMEWLEQQQNDGIRLMLLSNNTEERVAPFAKSLGMEYIANAKKPLTKNLKLAMSKMDVKLEETAIIGDQIFTDILCARLAKCTAIMTEPFEIENYGFYKIKRKLEVPVLKAYKESVKK